MNWPRYVNPAGTCEEPPPARIVIALASFFRFASPTCVGLFLVGRIPRTRCALVREAYGDLTTCHPVRVAEAIDHSCNLLDSLISGVSTPVLTRRPANAPRARY